MSGDDQDDDRGKPAADEAKAPEPAPEPARARPGRDWIGLVAGASKWVGLKPVRVRWKLENWRRGREQGRRRREQRADHIHYQHKTCDSCGAVQDRDATVCSRCGERLGRRGFQVLRRFGILAPQWLSMSSLLGAAFVLAFARVVLAAGGGIGDLFGLDPNVLFRFGGNFAPAVEMGERWRWLTACFLHGGLLHLGFNLFALSVVGPQVEALFGRLQMLFLFVATGVVGFIGSAWAGPVVVSIGASGGIMGLIGVAAGWGHRDGTTRGQALRNDMLKWSAYTFVFGFFLHADNWAHLFGLLPGLAFGMAVRPGAWQARAMAPLRAAAGVAGVAAALAALVLIARPPAADLGETFAGHEIGERLRPYVEICSLEWKGDHAGAALRLGASQRDGSGPPIDPANLAQECASVTGMLEDCRRGAAAPPDFQSGAGDPAQRYRVFCRALERAFESAPPPPRP
jgi:rhomboid protease GluP